MKHTALTFLTLYCFLASTFVANSYANPQPPELDRRLVSLVAEGEGEVWLQGDYMSESLIPTGYGNENSGIDYSKTLQIGGKYGLSDLWSVRLGYGLHDDQAWRSGEPQVARSKYQSEQFSISRLLFLGNEMEFSSHLGWRAHQADELFESAYSLANKPQNETTTAYARNNKLTIDQQQEKQTSIDFNTHIISLEQQSGNNITLAYLPAGDHFYISEHNTLLYTGSIDSEFKRLLGAPIEIPLDNPNLFPAPLSTPLPITDPTTPYTYLTHAKAYDRGVNGGLTASFYPSSRFRYSLGIQYRHIEVSPQFTIHPDLINTIDQTSNAASVLSSFINNDTTGTYIDRNGSPQVGTNLDALNSHSGTETTTETFDNTKTLLNNVKTSSDNYLSLLKAQIPQSTPWNEHHTLLSAGMDWWPYDDWGWAAEYTWYKIYRSNYNSTEGKVNLSVPDQTTNHQLDGWMFIKPTPSTTLYLHGRLYTNFLLGDRPLLYNARVNHRFDDPFGVISAGLVWQF